MKFNYKNIWAALVAVVMLTSCTSSDDEVLKIEKDEKGTMEWFFDHTLMGDKMLLDVAARTNGNGERLTIKRFNYIVSNIVLFDENGTSFTYPKEDSYFIIDSEKEQFVIQLKDIPAGNYTKVKFGLGVDQSKYLRGEEEQQEFWDLAATHNMTWSWITGYKFFNLEGTFTSTKVAGTPRFSLHIGSHGTNLDNYKEVAVALPSIARVRKTIKPSVHYMVDANKLVDGVHKIVLSEAMNPAGTAASIMVNAEKAPKIMENATQMFQVDHVHNDGQSHE